MINIHINVRKITLFLVIAFVLLFLANIAVVFLRYKFMPDSGFAGQLDQYFNFATEGNMPTFFNTILLFMAAQTFFLMGYTNERAEFYFRTYWYVIAAIFLFLSIDEFVRIHEWFSSGLPRKFGVGGSGLLKFAWILPYGIFVLLFGFYSIKILLSLERKQLIGYIGAGVMFLSGVIVMEALGGKYVENNNNIEDFHYFLYFTSVEESFEMLSMVWLLNINLRYLTKTKTVSRS